MQLFLVYFLLGGGKENTHELANDEIRAFCRKYKAPWIKSLFHDVRLWWGIRAVYDETCMNCECSAAHARIVVAAHMWTLRNLYVELSCTQLLYTIRFQASLGNVETTWIRYIGIFYQWNNAGDEISVKNLFLFRQFQPRSNQMTEDMQCAAYREWFSKGRLSGLLEDCIAPRTALDRTQIRAWEVKYLMVTLGDKP